MIDQHFIDSAVEIRKEWVKLMNSLESYQIQIDRAQRIISEKKQEVEEFGKRKLSMKDPIVKEFLENIFDQVEYQTNIIESKIKPLNDDIEKLKKEENILYTEIKKKYPNFSDEKLKGIIWEYIKYINPDKT